MALTCKLARQQVRQRVALNSGGVLLYPVNLRTRSRLGRMLRIPFTRSLITVHLLRWFPLRNVLTRFEVVCSMTIGLYVHVHGFVCMTMVSLCFFFVHSSEASTYRIADASMKE